MREGLIDGKNQLQQAYVAQHLGRPFTNEEIAEVISKAVQKTKEVQPLDRPLITLIKLNTNA